MINWRKWLFTLFVLPLARVSDPVRYRISDAFAFLLRRVVKYRRAVIDGNLAIAFPDKHPAERDAIRDAFYGSFTDVALEQVWLFDASPEEVVARTPATNPALVERVAALGRPIVIAAGHHNNYEMGAASLGLQLDFPIAAIYARLVNPYFDERLRETRGRFGLDLWPRGHVREHVDAWDREHDVYAVGFAFDQSPHGQRRKMWLPFFGRLTACTPGLEAYARRLDAVVLYIHQERVRRGYYRFTYHLVTERARDEPAGAISARANAMFESVLRRDPAGWLWSHRRWKLDISRDLTRRDLVWGEGEGVVGEDYDLGDVTAPAPTE